MLAVAGVPFGRWFRFMLPAFVGLLLLGAAALATGVRAGFRGRASPPQLTELGGALEGSERVRSRGARCRAAFPR